MDLNKKTGQQPAGLQKNSFPNVFFLNFQTIEATYLRMVGSLQRFCVPFYGLLTAEMCIYSKVADWKFKNEVYRRCFQIFIFLWWEAAVRRCCTSTCVEVSLGFWFNIVQVNDLYIYTPRKRSIFRKYTNNRKYRNEILGVIGLKTP